MRIGSSALLVLAIALSGAACSSSSSNGAPTETPSEADGGGGGGGTACSAARDSLLKTQSKVASQKVSLVSDEGGVKTIYVDATAGGINKASTSPRMYITLGGDKVDVSDADAYASPDWDLALKRSVLFTNSGDAGPGKGGAVAIDKSFDAVTAADADAVTPKTETFFDADCNPLTDRIGEVSTTFTDWYSYEESGNVVTPRDITFVVMSAAGVRHKVAIASYTGKPDGSTNAPAGAYYLLKVAPL